MEKRLRLGRVIARRELVATDTGVTVKLSVGTPRYIGDGWDWACPYTISGLGKPIHGHVHGIDALQTLQLISTALRGHLEHAGHPLTLRDFEDWRLGFPKLVPALPIPGLEARLAEVIDNELSLASARDQSIDPTEI